GGVGYDINCGVRLLISNMEADEIKPHISTLISALYRNVPSGVGKKGSIKLSPSQVDQVLEKGAAWAVKHG
ncbi:MAG: RNA-splicing ligase RtcB, partial [Anaerolineae bacterium]|nr:RNA-splicing ligase RtcB [Anaerolineae bacterium]